MFQLGMNGFKPANHRKSAPKQQKEPGFKGNTNRPAVGGMTVESYVNLIRGVEREVNNSETPKPFGGFDQTV